MILPWFINLEIFEFIPYRDRFQYRLVNSEWRRIISSTISKIRITEEEDYKILDSLTESLNTNKITFELIFFDENKLQFLAEKLAAVENIVLNRSLFWYPENYNKLELCMQKMSFRNISLDLTQDFSLSKKICHQRNLQSFKINANHLELKSNELFSILDSLDCPNLKYLNISGGFNYEEIIPLIETKFTKLHCIYWDCYHKDEVSTKKLFPIIPGLKRLHIVRYFSDPENIHLPSTGELPRLEILELGQYTSDALRINPLEDWPQIKYLKISRSHLGSDNCFLDHFPNLEVLDLDFYHLKPELCKDLLSNLGTLKFLRLGCPLDSSSVFEATLPKYHSLDQLSLFFYRDVPGSVMSWISYCLPSLFGLQLNGFDEYWSTFLLESSSQALSFPKLKRFITNINFPLLFWAKLLSEAPNFDSIYYDRYRHDNLISLKEKIPSLNIYDYIDLSDQFFYVKS